MFEVEMSARFLALEDRQFRWTIKLTRGKATFMTPFGMGLAHCKLGPTGGDGAELVMTRELASAIKPYGELTPAEYRRSVVPTAPTLRDVLESLQLDSRSGEHLLYEDFCSDLGYDTDSRAGEKIWRSCQETRGKLAKFFGDSFEEFMTFRFDE